MGAGASLKAEKVREDKECETDAMAKSKGDSAPGSIQDPVPDPLAEEEAFYQAHRDDLLDLLRWNQAKLQPRSEGGVGLLNQGATCYMNSLLQSLFNIPEFRLAVYQFEHLPELHGDPSRCIPLQLQRLFAELQLSRSSAASTKELTTACGFRGRDAMEQHDVQELCRVLFDALERSSSMLAEVIRDLYSGKVTHYTRCAEDRQGQVYESQRPASYMDLQVPIQDCKSLEEALRQLVKPTLLSGDNQWLCEELGEKVDALIGTTIDTLPKILCLQLLRFVFDVQLMRRKKLSDSVAIPLKLDVSCLGHEGSYELSAVCLHSGTAHGGHYHAFLRDLHSGVWKDANDSRVHILGQRQCEALFAAEASGPVLYSSDAYFLLYRKTGMPTPDLQVLVPPRLSQPILAENQRLTLLQRAFELHRRLVEVKVHLPSAAPRLQRRYFAQQLAGLVEEEVAQEEIPAVSFSSLDGRPEKILERALKSFAELDQKHLDLQALSSARLWHFDPLRGVAKGLFAGASSSGGYGGRVELVLQPQGLEPAEHTGELLLLVLWPGPQLPQLSLQHTTTLPWCKVVEQDENCKAAASATTPPETLQPEAAADASDDELPDIFASAMPVRPSGPKPATLADVRSAAAKLWKLPLEATVLVALTGMQAGQEIEGDDVTLQECGLSPDDILCVEQRLDGGALPRAKQLYEMKRNRTQMFFNHPDRPDDAEEFPPISISKDATLAQLKAQIAESLALESKEIHLAMSRDSLTMFKDEDRTLRQVGLGDLETVFVGHGAPCDPNKKILKVLRYSSDNGNHKVSDGFNFPAPGEMSVRSFKEALIEAGHWTFPEVTWKRLRLRDGQAGKQFAVLRDQRTLRSALMGFADGRQVAVQLMEEEEELGADDLLLLVRPWRVVEARLHAPTEMVVSKNQPLVEFQAKLTERYKGLLQDRKDEADKENQPENLEEDKLEICVAHATGPPMTIKRCETLKWSESRLCGISDVTLADLKELRDGVTLIVRSRAAALRGAQVESKAVKGNGKGPTKGSQAGRKGAAHGAQGAQGQTTQTLPVTVATAKSRAERSLVIQVAHPEADESEAAETPG